MEAKGSKLDRLYALVANEEDARACTNISDDACRVVPGNFFLISCCLVLTKIGDLLVSPKIVLAWLLGAVGAPAPPPWRRVLDAVYAPNQMTPLVILSIMKRVCSA